MLSILKISLIVLVLIITSTSPIAMGTAPETEKNTINKPRLTETWPFTISLTTPHPGWTISIEKVYQNSTRVGVLATVSIDPTIVSPQVISTAECSILIKSKPYPVTVIITGKTWQWSNPSEPYIFVDNLSKLNKKDNALFNTKNEVSFKIIPPK